MWASVRLLHRAVTVAGQPGDYTRFSAQPAEAISAYPQAHMRRPQRDLPSGDPLTSHVRAAHNGNQHQLHKRIAISLCIWFTEGVANDSALTDAAQLFRVLGNESRLWLLLLLREQPMGVGALVEATGESQPLVSQHLRALRQSGLVTVTRQGREATYHLADFHVAHLVTDALTHVREPADHSAAEQSAAITTPQKENTP